MAVLGLCPCNGGARVLRILLQVENFPFRCSLISAATFERSDTPGLQCLRARLAAELKLP